MEEQALEFLLRYSDWIKDAGFFSSIWHMFVMGLVRISYHVAFYTEKVIDQIFRITGFLDEGIVGTVYTSMRVLAGSILAVTIIYVTYKYLFSDRVDLKGSLLRGIIFLNLIIYLPGLMNSAIQVTKDTFDATKDLQETGSSLSYNIVRSNMADLTYLSRNGFELLNSTDVEDQTMNLSEQAFKNADLTELILPSDIKELQKSASNEEETEALGYQIKVADDGSLYAEKIKNGWFSTFDNGKFRFKADASTILISLWTMTFVYLCSAFTIGIAIVELAFAKLLFPALAASDIESGQKVKAMFLDMINTLVTVMLTGLTISLFSVYFSYLATLNLNIVSYGILCLVGMSMSMAGPKTFGKYLGVSTSARSGFKSIMGGYYAAKGMAGMGKAAVGAGAAALHAPEAIRDASSKVVNGVANKVDHDKKLLKSVGQGMQDGVSRAQDGLNQQVNDIFDDQNATIDPISPVDANQYPSEEPGKNMDHSTEEKDETNENNKIHGHKDQEGQSTELQSDNTNDPEKMKVQETIEEKSVNDRSGDLDDKGMVEPQDEQGADVDEHGKTNVPDLGLDQPKKSVKDATEFSVKEPLGNQPAEKPHPNEESANKRPAGEDAKGHSVENPEKKTVDPSSNEGIQKQTVGMEDSTVSKTNTSSVSEGQGQKVGGNHPNQASETLKPPSSSKETVNKKEAGNSSSELHKASDKTIYNESEAKLIWEEKKRSDQLFADANESLKNLNAEDFLPRRNGDDQPHGE